MVESKIVVKLDWNRTYFIRDLLNADMMISQFNLK
jgi:hypothetical protein